MLLISTILLAIITVMQILSFCMNYRSDLSNKTDKHPGKIDMLEQSREILCDALITYGNNLPDSYDMHTTKKIVKIHNDLNAIINELTEERNK